MNKTATTFNELSSKDVDIAGGKGASLGEMTQAGIPVPPGFVILSSAFERFLEETHLNIEVEAALDTVNHKEIHTIENASEKIQALILESEIPKDILNEIKNFFKKLDTTYVAVRSSATAEDSANSAWAGQLESYLNTTEETLLENVKKCWASLFTPRAIFYRFEKELRKQKISVAVVIQKMVESEKSGIAFSVHPVTEDHNQLIIEAGFGLGEAVVSGAVTPDSYVVQKNPEKIIDTVVNTQSRALYRRPEGGNEWKDLNATTGASQVLSQKQILNLSQIILNIEKHYGFPCDIEWAFEKDKFYITQSRPITTLGKITKNHVEKKWQKLWSRDYGVQFFYSPMFGFNAYPIEKGLGIQNVMVLPENGMQSIFVLRDEFGSLMSYIKSFYIEDLNNLRKFISEFQENGKIFVRNSFEYSRGVEGVSNEVLNDRLNSFNKDFRSYGAYLWLTFLINEKMSEFLVSCVEKATLSPKEKSELIEYAIKPSNLSGVFLLGIEAQNKSISILAQEFSWLTTLDIHNKPATEEDIRARIPEKQNINTKIPTILQDVSPEVREIIILSKDTTYAKDLRDDFRRKAILNIIPLFEEIAQRTSVKRNNLSYLSLDEISDLLKKQIDRNEATNEAMVRRSGGFLMQLVDSKLIIESNLEKIKNIALKNDLDIWTPQIISSKEIVGVIGQKGFVKGRVVVVSGIKEIQKVSEGDVLCTVTTNPDYLPAMQKAVAFITDEGGITCHAAIIARELGKPCIVGTKNGTKILKDGDVVEVDANSGIIRVLN